MSYLATAVEGRDTNTAGTSKPAVGLQLPSPDREDQYPQAFDRVNAMVQNIKASSASLGLDENFVYLNYAKANQDPIGSYGVGNAQHIRKVARKYDHNGFFQTRVPSGFKLA
jgi:hypothetical protein